MIVIDKVLVSDQLLEAEFLCNLSACKGGCCEDGDAGAPLREEELDELIAAYERISGLLSEEGRQEISRKGLYRYHAEFGWVTPTVGGKICAYGVRDAEGVIRCMFEQAWREGTIAFRKPLSCHLYPLKVSKSRYSDYEMVNYEPREKLCAPGCAMGKQLGMPVYRFLKDALIRKFGPDFYAALDDLSRQHQPTDKMKP